MQERQPLKSSVYFRDHKYQHLCCVACSGETGCLHPQLFILALNFAQLAKQRNHSHLVPPHSLPSSFSLIRDFFADSAKSFSCCFASQPLISTPYFPPSQFCIHSHLLFCFLVFRFIFLIFLGLFSKLLVKHHNWFKTMTAQGSYSSFFNTPSPEMATWLFICILAGILSLFFLNFFLFLGLKTSRFRKLTL